MKDEYKIVYLEVVQPYINKYKKRSNIVSFLNLTILLTSIVMSFLSGNLAWLLFIFSIFIVMIAYVFLQSVLYKNIINDLWTYNTQEYDVCMLIAVLKETKKTMNVSAIDTALLAVYADSIYIEDAKEILESKTASSKSIEYHRIRFLLDQDNEELMNKYYDFCKAHYERFSRKNIVYCQLILAIATIEKAYFNKDYQKVIELVNNFNHSCVRLPLEYEIAYLCVKSYEATGKTAIALSHYQKLSKLNDKLRVVQLAKLDCDRILKGDKNVQQISDLFPNNEENSLLGELVTSKYPSLQWIIPSAFHTKINELVEDYTNLQDVDLYNKYHLYNKWPDYDAFTVIKKGNFLPLLVFDQLISLGYIVEFDWKDDIDTFHVKNYWGTSDVKLVQFDVSDANQFIAYLPVDIHIKSLLGIEYTQVEEEFIFYS